VYGGNGPDSWDCSGLTQAAFASVGLSLPRVSTAQHGMGYSTSISNLTPGDLVAWDGHVAIYSGGGNIIEAAKPGTNVRERPLADHWFDQGAWGVALDYSTL
jgi:cell wall-associated NlpC family hydrolase